MVVWVLVTIIFRKDQQTHTQVVYFSCASLSAALRQNKSRDAVLINMESPATQIKKHGRMNPLLSPWIQQQLLIFFKFAHPPIKLSTFIQLYTMINIQFVFVFVVTLSMILCENEAFITNGHLREVRYKIAQDFYKQRLKNSNCTNGFYCGEKCLGMEKYRDGVKDCADGSDENCWPGAVKCSNNNMCVDEGDKAKLCISPSDSKYCQMPNVFLCKNGNCILNLWVNDDKNDCGDWSDELSNLTRIRNALKPSV